MDVENYLGFVDLVMGFWLMEQMQKQVENVGIKIIYDIIIKVDFSVWFFWLEVDSGIVFMVDILVIVIGVQVCWFGLFLEQDYMGVGVFVCVMCDGFFYCNKEVVVVGGGNIVVEEVLYLVNLVFKVMLVYWCDSFWVEKILQDWLFQNLKIEVIWDYQVDEIVGGGVFKVVIGVCLKNIQFGEFQEIFVDGVFIVIGYVLFVELFKDQLMLKLNGYLEIVFDFIRMLIFGVFVVGDVIDDIYCQVVMVVGMGCMVVFEVEKFFVEQEVVGI